MAVSEALLKPSECGVTDPDSGQPLSPTAKADTSVPFDLRPYCIIVTAAAAAPTVDKSGESDIALARMLQDAYDTEYIAELRYREMRHNKDSKRVCVYLLAGKVIFGQASQKRSILSANNTYEEQTSG